MIPAENCFSQTFPNGEHTEPSSSLLANVMNHFVQQQQNERSGENKVMRANNFINTCVSHLLNVQASLLSP